MTIEQLRGFVDDAVKLGDKQREEILEEAEAATSRQWEVEAITGERGSMAKGTIQGVQGALEGRLLGVVGTRGPAERPGAGAGVPCPQRGQPQYRRT